MRDIRTHTSRAGPRAPWCCHTARTLVARRPVITTVFRCQTRIEDTRAIYNVYQRGNISDTKSQSHSERTFAFLVIALLLLLLLLLLPLLLLLLLLLLFLFLLLLLLLLL